MGPQPGAGPALACPPLGERVAAGLDSCRATRREPQVGQATSRSSEARMMRDSKEAWQAGQLYS
jgi:hypothetical protein